MQRAEPRPDPSQAQPQVQPQEQGAASKQWNLPTGFASTGNSSHTQSFEEIYGIPENFLEIEVCQTDKQHYTDTISLQAQPAPLHSAAGEARKHTTRTV